MELSLLANGVRTAFTAISKGLSCWEEVGVIDLGKVSSQCMRLLLDFLNNQ